LLAIFSIILSSYGVVKGAINDVINKKITANILMLIAAIASFFILHGQEGATAILLYAIAEHIEELTTDKSRDAIKELLELSPDEALLKKGNEYISVPTIQINKGDIIGVKPAMKVPLDGIIIKGKSYFDESTITGESLPVFKNEGDEVFAASINSEGFVDVEVTRETNDTVVAQIARSIKEAQQNKSKSEKFIEKFAKYYTPIILIMSLMVMILPFNNWFYRGLILLVVSCPCALTLSTPLANITALTKLAKEGILVKGNVFIEKVDKIQAIAFDKTGTLTEGSLKVFEVRAYEGYDENAILSIAASLESLSEHPIGQAIVSQAKRMNVKLLNVSNFEILKGMGIKGEINGRLYYIGSQNFFNELNFNLPIDELKEIEENGTIPILVGNNGLIGLISIRDVLRITSPLLIDGLKKRKYKSILISGDNQTVCNTIGYCLDIDNIYGELLPDQKLEEIKKLKANYKGVAMVGDGINDAPALALSDLGIAIGASATDLTLETADVIIINDDLKKIIDFIDISKKTNKIIKQNIWASISIKLSFAVLTVIGLMTLWLAVGIGDMGVSLAVMLNAMRIFRYKNKISEISSDIINTESIMIICENCKTKQIIPQHHGRDMIQSEDKLICWRKMLNSDILESCEQELPLFCPSCNNKLSLV
jgi:Cd2+/Zn2+-exporting ATPase